MCSRLNKRLFSVSSNNKMTLWRKKQNKLKVKATRFLLHEISIKSSSFILMLTLRFASWLKFYFLQTSRV